MTKENKVIAIKNTVFFIGLSLLTILMFLLLWILLGDSVQAKMWLQSLGFKFGKRSSMQLVEIEKMFEAYKKKFSYRPMGFKSVNDLQKDVDHWVLLKEGGLTDNKSDSASAYPAPITYTVVKAGKPYTSSSWHTNKGLTYRAFVDSAKAIGYSATPSLFVQMPDWIPLAVFKKQYADAYKENSGNALIDFIGALWAWGSGVGGEKALLTRFITDNKMSLNELYKKDAPLLFANLILYRIMFFERLAKQKPQNKVFLKGWINSELNFYENFKKYIN